MSQALLRSARGAVCRPLVRSIVSSSVIGPRNVVDNSQKYDEKHKYPQPGTYVESNTNPNKATGRPVPLNVALTHYAPMKHPITHGDNVCDLQLRSFFTEDLEFYCNFVLRVAFYLKIPVKGVTPLPRRTERWTVIKSPFVHAKTKENFERRTHKRLIKLYDANPDVVQIFLSTVRRYCISGVGMKATIYDQEDVNILDRLESVESGDSAFDVSNIKIEEIDPELAKTVKSILESPEFKPLMEQGNKKN
ncbi:small ribosomal subunit protein uS10m [Trichomonascus vanleenenianus]|uniref:mitochondrial 37S ribosomal protein uS10m RSM10 n=1 Tax=Trichomonascus vanleenenianus TaxID=2268995 RepID=UPI003ECA9C0B